MKTEHVPRSTHCRTRAEDVVHALEAERTEAEEARVAAERTNVQLQAIQALTDTALSHLTLDDLLLQLLGRVTAVLGVDHVAILLLDEDGRTLTMRAVLELEEEYVVRERIPLGRGLAGRVAASRVPLMWDDTSGIYDEAVHPPLSEYLRSALGVPLLVQDPSAGQLVSRLVGTLSVGSTAPRRFSEADVQLLQRAADRIALAIDRAHLYAAEHDARRQAEEALARAQASEARAAEREASRRLEAFLSVAAHDLRSPLTSVVGYLALAKRQTERLAATAESESPEFLRQVAVMRQRLEDANQGTQRLTRLLTLLFDTSAIRTDRLELHRKVYNLVALVREQVAGQRAAAPGCAIRLHPPAGGQSVLVEADADRIGQVVANYLTNALKNSPPDRPVEVSMNVSAEAPPTGGDWAHVAVRDAGLGIPEAERERVWELFHWAPGVEAQGRTHCDSLGLGLYICKVIIEAHGGQVGVESAVGEGSTFWFTLPLACAKDDPASAQRVRRNRTSLGLHPCD